jgi:hypothetical protein
VREDHGQVGDGEVRPDAGVQQDIEAAVVADLAG